MKDNRPRGCYNRFRYPSEKAAKAKQRERAAAGQRMRAERCKTCGGWHLFGT